MQGKERVQGQEGARALEPVLEPGRTREYGPEYALERVPGRELLWGPVDANEERAALWD